jgi:hypothetical protein
MKQMLDKKEHRDYIDDLKRRAGKEPFTRRLTFTGNSAPCPFHEGGGEPLSLNQNAGGWWQVTCHSECNKTWDAISFIEKKEGVDFKTAIGRIGGRVGKPHAVTSATAPKAKAMTHAEWLRWGHEPTVEDIAILAASRKDKTASAETFAALGARVKDGKIGLPYFLTLPNGERRYFTVKTRGLRTKDIRQENCASNASLFNLDTVNCFDPVYVVEGEPDVAILEAAGFRAVSVMNATHCKFLPEQIEILCEATHIFLVGDQKQRGAGDPGGQAIAALASNLPRGKFSRITFGEAKDACELASQYGDSFTERINELTKEALTPWVSKNIPNVTPLLRLKDPEWVVDRMLPLGGVTIFCAAQGGNKTTVALALAKAIANPIATDFKFLGREILGHTRKQIGDGAFLGLPDIPVLYIDRENPPVVIGNRLKRMGMLASENFLYWGDGDPNNETPEVNDPRLEDWVKQTGGLIVFDSLQDWYGDAKEIDNSAMVKIMHGFRRLARLGAGVVILHHVAKDSDLNNPHAYFRGATGIIAIPDMAIAIQKPESEPDLLRFREIRFRMCKTWELDAKLEWEKEVNWKNPDVSFAIGLSVVSDAGGKPLFQVKAERAKAKACEKAATKAAAEKEKATVVSKAIEENPKASQRKLGEETGIDRNIIPRLAGIKGWKFSEKTKQWEKAAPATEEENG